MPDATKPKKTKIKVEEIPEEPEEAAPEVTATDEKLEEKDTKASTSILTPPETTEEETMPTEPDEDKPLTSTSPPKVTSFSQLDTEKSAASSSEETPASIDEKGETQGLEPEKPEVAESEEGKKEDVSSDEIKEWLKEVRPDTSKEVEKSGGPNTKVVFLIVIVLLVLGAIVGGVLYYKQNMTKPEKGKTPSVTENTPTPSPTQAPSEEVDLSTLSVSVLNGSGVAGEAKKVKDLLVEEGFASDKVSTGNADATSYEKTSVSLKKGLSEKVFGEIKSKLEDTYDVEMSKTALEEDSTYDVIVIVGKKK